jgi:hypothetical protein
MSYKTLLCRFVYRAAQQLGASVPFRSSLTAGQRGSREAGLGWEMGPLPKVLCCAVASCKAGAASLSAHVGGNDIYIIKRSLASPATAATTDSGPILQSRLPKAAAKQAASTAKQAIDVQTIVLGHYHKDYSQCVPKKSNNALKPCGALGYSHQTGYSIHTLPSQLGLSPHSPLAITSPTPRAPLPAAGSRSACSAPPAARRSRSPAPSPAPPSNETASARPAASPSGGRRLALFQTSGPPGTNRRRWKRRWRRKRKSHQLVSAD